MENRLILEDLEHNIMRPILELVQGFYESHLRYFEILLFFYILFALTFLINTYLMPCLDTISKTFNLKEYGTGVLLAIGCSVPEMTTNIISCLGGRKEMIGFGFGVIAGSGVFDFTICFGIASVFSFYFHKKAIGFNIDSLLRDIYVYLLSLLYLVFIFWDFKISLVESLSLISFYPLYLLYCNYSQSRARDLNHVPEPPSRLRLPWTKMYNNFIKDPYNIYHTEAPIDYEEHYINQSVHKRSYFSSDEDENDEEISVLIAKEAHSKYRDFDLGEELIRISKIVLTPWKFLFRKTLPNQERHPLLCFIVIMTYSFFFTRFIVGCVDSIIDLFNVSPSFVGLTLSSWGGNISDIVNATVSAKNMKTELATATIIGSQIINLHLCLGVPWFLSNVLDGPLKLNGNAMFFSVSTVFVVVLCSVCFMYAEKFKLTARLGYLLISVYMIFFSLEFYFNLLRNTQT